MDKLDEALSIAKRKAEHLQSSIDQLRPLAHELAGLPPPEASSSSRQVEVNGSSGSGIRTRQTAQNLGQDRGPSVWSDNNASLLPAISAMSGDDAKVALAVSVLLSRNFFFALTRHCLRTSYHHYHYHSSP